MRTIVIIFQAVFRFVHPRFRFSHSVSGLFAHRGELCQKVDSCIQPAASACFNQHSRLSHWIGLRLIATAT